MKKKLRLALDELDRELSAISQAESYYILGGSSSGLSSGSSMGEVVNYFTGLGMTFTQDSNGNYFFGSTHTTGATIMIDEVVVYANSSGSSGGVSVESAFVNYFEQFGFVFSGGGGGGGSYQIFYSYLGHDNKNDNDPWLRDTYGNIVTVNPPVWPPEMFELGYDGITLNMEKVYLKMADGTDVTAFKVVSVYDNNVTRPPTIAERSNCFGLAFADGEYWFWDPTSTVSNDEFADFAGILGPSNSNSIYEECSKSEATMAVIYSDTGLTNPYHAGLYDPVTDTYIAKGGIGSSGSYVGETNFRVPNPNDSNAPRYDVGEIKYYRLRQP